MTGKTTGTIWAVRDLDAATISKIKIRAATDRVSIAEALKRMVEQLESGSGTAAE